MRNTDGRRQHPLYWRWHGLAHREGSMCETWRNDFWLFVREVEPRPDGATKLLRLRQEEPVGPTNFRWALTPTEDEQRAYVRDWHRRNRDYSRERHFREKYGIGIAEYEAMFAAQDGRCAICNQTETRMDNQRRGLHRQLAVDHDHQTGAVRGLLCGQCNLMLGAASESPVTLLKAIGYLRHHERKRLQVVE